MQRAYSGWELKAYSGSHGSFPAVPTCFAGENLHDGVATHGFSLSGRLRRFMSFPRGAAGCSWSLWPEDGMVLARAHPRQRGMWRCSSTGCGAARGSPPQAGTAGAPGAGKRGLPGGCVLKNAASVDAGVCWACSDFHP